MYDGRIAGSQQAAPTSQARLTQVQEQVERGCLVNERIEQKLSNLRDRLAPVLANVPSQPGSDANKVPQPTLVGHANALSNHNAQLETFDAVLGDILDRLEL